MADDERPARPLDPQDITVLTAELEAACRTLRDAAKPALSNTFYHPASMDYRQPLHRPLCCHQLAKLTHRFR